MITEVPCHTLVQQLHHHQSTCHSQRTKITLSAVVISPKVVGKRNHPSYDTTKNYSSTGDTISPGKTFEDSQKVWCAHAQRQPRQPARNTTPFTSGVNAGPSTWMISRRPAVVIADVISIRNAMETTRKCVSLINPSKSTLPSNCNAMS